MAEKIDNPQDHKHSDYDSGFVVVLIAIAAIAALALTFWAHARIESVDERLDRQAIETECRLADDEAECLRGYLP